MKISKMFLFVGVFCAVVYFSIAIFLLNPSLVSYTLLSSISVFNKISLLFALLESSWMMLGHTDFFLLIITSLLVGSNISLSLMLLKRIRQVGKVSFAFGGGSLFGVFSAGCASCGFSAFSLFGFSGTVALFPLHGAELYLLAITLLVVTMYYNIRNLQKPLICKNPKS